MLNYTILYINLVNLLLAASLIVRFLNKSFEYSSKIIH